MKVLSIPLSDITIGPKRQRKEINHEKISELAGSISQNGLIQPVVVRRDRDRVLLIAGERRLRAMEYLLTFGEQIRCGETTFVEGHVPCIDLGDLDSIDAFEVELEENIRREDLSWPDRCRAVSQLAELRRLQAEKRGDPIPSVSEIAAEAHEDMSAPAAHELTRRELILARHLEDPDVAKARTIDEGFKILKRKEEAKKNLELAERIGVTFSSADHTLLQGNCLEVMATLPNESFDVILTDPPYGINAQEFGDSGGMAPSGHEYDDSPTEWRRLMEPACAEFFRLAKPLAHAYIFCDIEMFIQLRIYLTMAGWNVFRTPLIWYNPQGMRAPWPDKGPQRKYQLIAYAEKGGRHVKKLSPDVLTYGSDSNLGHAAQKPVAVYLDLLMRSAGAGDTVLDPFCGSGTIFPAAHGMKVKATGIERDPQHYGLASKRLRELK